MTDLIKGAEPAKIMAGDKQVLKKYLGGSKFYQYYQPAGTVVYQAVNTQYGDFRDDTSSVDIVHSGNQVDDGKYHLNCRYDQIKNGVIVHFNGNQYVRLDGLQTRQYFDGHGLMTNNDTKVPLGDPIEWAHFNFTSPNVRDAHYTMQIKQDSTGMAFIYFGNYDEYGTASGENTTWMFDNDSEGFSCYALVNSITAY